MAESNGAKILRFPNRKERRTNLAKAGGKTRAPVTSDKSPEPPPTYDEKVEELPRYLRRAFESRDVDRVEACIKKALQGEWTEAALVKAMHKFTTENNLNLN
jgi:hypothetical protein